jgi:PAS domain S-box-containing protein
MANDDSHTSPLNQPRLPTLTDQLAQQQQWFAVVLSSIGDGVITADVHGRVSFMNPVAETLTGWTNSEAIGRPLEQVFHIVNEETRASVENPALRAIREGTIFGLANHTLLLAKDGREVSIDDSGAPIRTAAGESLGAVLVFRDVSERRKFDEARGLLAEIVDSSEEVIISKSLDGRITSWNAAAERLFGYSAGEAIGEPITLIIPPHRRDEETTILSRLRRGERIDNLETERVAKDGREVMISLTASPVRNRHGDIIGASKIAHDVTAHRRVEDALRFWEARLAADANALAKLNALSSRLWQIRALGDGLEEMLAATIELLGADKGNIQLVEPERNVLVIAAHRGFPQEFLDFFREVSVDDNTACGRSLRTGARVVIEDVETDDLYAPLRPQARHAGYRAVQSTPLLDRDGQPLGMLSTHWHSPHRPTDHQLRSLDLYARQAVDFIERCRTEEALRQADQLKDQFLATLSHELRTPLNAILGWAHMLRKGMLEADVADRALESLERNAKAQSQLVEDLLDISRILSEKLQIRHEATDLRAVIEGAIDAVRQAAAAKHVTLAVSLEPTEGPYVTGDAVRLRQIVWNLLSNAIKFTPSGGRVEVVVTHSNSEANIVVRDSGVGIEPQFLPFVFDRFRQADGGTTRRHGGLGLGLAIAKHIAEAHGGTVTAESGGTGEGAIFTVRLPAIVWAPPPAPPRRGAADAPRLLGVRVLVVDDEADARELMRAILESEAAVVSAVQTAGEALLELQQHAFDVLISDIAMPDQDGLWLVRAIRQGPELQRDTPAIAVTAYAGSRERAMAAKAGYNWHLAKPVDPDQLVALVATAASGGPARLA